MSPLFDLLIPLIIQNIPLVIIWNKPNPKINNPDFYFCGMILSDISFKWKYDYEMSPEEQTFHEHFIDSFKFKMSRFLNECGFGSNYRICFELQYFPQLRKFYVNSISLNENVLLSHLKNSYQLKSFFVWQIPKLDEI